MKEFFKTIFGIQRGAVNDESPKYTVDKVDWYKVGVHAVIVASSAALLVVSEVILKIDFGQYNALLVPVISSALVWLQKFLKNNESEYRV